MKNQINEDNIRVAAYYIWEQAGRPEGQEKECWIKACEQLFAAGAKETACSKTSCSKTSSKTSSKPATKTSSKTSCSSSNKASCSTKSKSASTVSSKTVKAQPVLKTKKSLA